MKKQPINRIEIGKGLSVIHNSGNVMTLYIDNVFEGWEQWLLLSSDRHHDSIDCNRELELEHLEECKKRKAFIIDVGDMYDCMQGRFDPRKSYKNLRPEYKEDDYLDVIVKDAAEFYSPFVNQFLMIGRGNHESAVLKNNSTDLIDRTVYELNSHYSGHIQAGGYGGWVRILCKIGSTQCESVKIKYFHGSGGGGPVTRGVIQTNRQAVFLPDADIVVNGHTHDSWYVPIEQERMSDKGDVYQSIQHHIRTATYHNDYGDGSGGWHVERGGAPKPQGACWIRLSIPSQSKDLRKKIKIEPIAAIQ
jgi:predicted phosphodiesterase